MSFISVDGLAIKLYHSGRYCPEHFSCCSIPSFLLGSWPHRVLQSHRTKRCSFAWKNLHFNSILYYKSSYFHKPFCKRGQWGQSWFKDRKKKLTSVNDLSKTMAKSKWKHRVLDVSSSAKTTRASFSSLCKEKAAGSRLLGQIFKGSDYWDFKKYAVAGEFGT